MTAMPTVSRLPIAYSMQTGGGERNLWKQVLRLMAEPIFGRKQERKQDNPEQMRHEIKGRLDVLYDSRSYWDYLPDNAIWRIDNGNDILANLRRESQMFSCLIHPYEFYVFVVPIFFSLHILNLIALRPKIIVADFMSGIRDRQIKKLEKLEASLPEKDQ